MSEAKPMRDELDEGLFRLTGRFSEEALGDVAYD